MYKSRIVISDGIKISERLLSQNHPVVEWKDECVFIHTKEYSVCVNQDHFIYMVVENVDKNENTPDAK